MVKHTILHSFMSLLLGTTMWGRAQDKPDKLPRFEDYPVHQIFSGVLSAPHIPDWVKKEDAESIKNGVEKGWGVFHDFQEKKGPNFAGRFVLMTWSCGAPCIEMAIVDAGSGEVYSPPIMSGGLEVRSFFLPPFTYPGPVSRNPEIQFRLSSDLLVISCNDPPGFRPYTFYFLWQNNQWTLLRKVSLKIQSR